MTVAAARHAVNTAALARDRVALAALGASLPATTAYVYERHRARAYAHALEGSGDSALGELAAAAAAMPPPAAVLAADGAGLQLLLGDPARSIESIALAAQNDPRFDDFGRSVLLAATREAPSEWRRAARAAALVRHPRASLVALGAAFNALGDRRSYRVALAATGLLTALFALLALPTLLVDGGTPVAGVTAPSFTAPPSVVVVPTQPTPRPRPLAPEPAVPASGGGQATLVRATPSQRPSVGQPGRPRAAQPRPAPTPSPPAPAPQPSPQPAPQPTPPTVSLAVAPPAAAPAPAAAPPQANNGKGKGKAKAKGDAKQAAKAAAAAAAAPQPTAPAPAAPPATSEPPGQAKKDDKSDKQDKNA